MTNPHLVFYSVLLIGTVVKAQQKCIELEAKPEITDCCTKPKPYYCLFKNQEEQAADPLCNCRPHDKNGNDLLRQENQCVWNSVYDNRDGDSLDWTVPCTGFETLCQPREPINSVVVANTGKSRYISCLVPNGPSKIIYPPRYETLKTRTVNELPTLHCNLKNKHGDPMNDSEFYGTFLACWLLDCEIRLKKPGKNKYISASVVGGWENLRLYLSPIFFTSSNRFCVPPILYPGSNFKYCPLYDMVLDVYSSSQKEAFFTQFEKSANIPCVLPPFCEPGKPIDSSLFMTPLIGDKPDNTYCEVICPADSNIGVDKESQPCRRRPTCKEGDKYKVKQFVTSGPPCLEWCSPEDSYFKKVEHRTEKECNNIPVCAQGGVVPTPFTIDNPYGLTDDKTVKCLERRDCDASRNETKATHYCSLDDEKATLKNVDGGSPGVDATLAASLTAGVVLVIILLAFVIVIAVVIHRRNRRRRLDTVDAAESGADHAPPKRAFNITDTTEWRRLAQKNAAGESAMMNVSQMSQVPKPEPKPQKTDSVTKTQTKSKSKSTRSRSNPTRVAPKPSNVPKSPKTPKTKKMTMRTAQAQTTVATSKATTTAPQASSVKEARESGNIELNIGMGSESRLVEKKKPLPAEPGLAGATYDNVSFPTHLTDTAEKENSTRNAESPKKVETTQSGRPKKKQQDLED